MRYESDGSDGLEMYPKEEEKAFIGECNYVYKLGSGGGETAIERFSLLFGGNRHEF